MKKKSKKRIIVILLISIIVIMFFIINKYNKSVKNRSVYESGEITEENDVFGYKNMSKIISKGSISIKEITNIIENVVKKYIPNLAQETNKMSEKQLLDYYQNNKEEIIKKIYISSAQEFKNFIEQIKNLNCNITDYDYCEYLDEESNEEYFAFRIFYKNGNNLMITIKVN